MSDEFDYLGRTWGERMRDKPNGWYRENYINRLYEDEYLGSGNNFKARAVTSDRLDTNDQYSYQPVRRNDFRISASGESAATYGALGRNSSFGTKKINESYRPKIPIKLMSKDQIIFHRAWRRLNDEWHQAVIWTQYVPDVDHKRKVALLRTTSKSYDAWLDLSLRTIAREIKRLDVEIASKASVRKQMPRQENGSTRPLWSGRIFSYAHKLAINDSLRDPFPICLSKTGHGNERSPYVKGPIDQNIYCKRPTGDIYAAVPCRKWKQLQNQGQLNGFLADLQKGAASARTPLVPSRRPIRILHQTPKGQWLVGKEDEPKGIRKLKALGHIAIAWQSPGEDALRAIQGIDNDARLPAYSTEDSFDQKAMRGFQTPEEVKILGIQSAEVQSQIKQKLAEFEEKISEADEQGQTELCKLYKKDLRDFKRLTKGSCITKTRSRPADDGDIFRPILNNLSQRKRSALGVLRKNGLHDEADDLEHCYKIENRTAIFFASRSRFTWKFDRE